MNRFWKTSLLVILLGLLFSPAEGICLLPIRDAVPVDAVREYSVSSRPTRFQSTVIRAEKNPDDANKFGRSYGHLFISSGVLSARFCFDAELVESRTARNSFIPHALVDSHFHSAQGPRPPPSN